ncbi:hypothetical protein GCM10018793_62470 [Streptomyces sulfonofaciens]|uniref:Integrin-like protein n=1 Tax=Streptomyces sulfonofaciens TaxID=68272 RepID=A0A919GMF2_9ACTN|nr:FG-GAP and VCBS repeat-containing protein [Streptomyces sulfonofaciens]GHH87278.1 hypothetical protein GCM10018793_62470 [Streptomyces sulfonofaciens]
MNLRRAAGGLGLAAALAVSLSVTAPVAFANPAELPAGAALRDDFNGDGYADVAFAAPDATVGGKAKAGYVAVMYGSAQGLRTSSKQVFDQDSPGMPGVAEEGDAYGSSVTTADLDRDGYADLVVGSAGEDVGTAGSNAGSLAVIWGGAQGLAGSATLLNGAEAYDAAGGHTVAGDFNGDRVPDLATVADSKDLRVLTGPFERNGAPVGGVRDVTDDFDSRILDLAAGDVNGDGMTDIAAVANDGDEYDDRRITYWQGTGEGPAPYVTVRKPDGGRLEGGENLDIGDVNADGYADIVAGRPIDGYDSDLDLPLAEGGMVTYLPGSAKGPDVSLAGVLNQDSPGVPGVAEGSDGYGNSDNFGTGVSVGDIDGDGYADVAVGVPGETFDGRTHAGSVVTLRGSARGLTGTGAAVLSQDTDGVPGAAEAEDRFGSATKLVDADGNGTADLVVGATGENENAGSVWVLRSTASGVTPAGSFTFGAGTLGTVAANAKLGSGFDF